MRTKSIISIMFVAIICASCSSLKQVVGTTTNGITPTSPAYTSGAGFGTALSNLYKSYKTAGNNVNLSDANTWINVISLATNASVIKGNMKDATFYKNFAAGSISGSSNLITSSTVDKVISSAIGLDLNTILSAGKNASSLNSTSASSIASGLATILGAMGK